MAKILAAKATTVVVRLREFAKEYNDGVESIRKQTIKINLDLVFVMIIPPLHRPETLAQVLV